MNLRYIAKQAARPKKSVALRYPESTSDFIKMTISNGSPQDLLGLDGISAKVRRKCRRQGKQYETGGAAAILINAILLEIEVVGNFGGKFYRCANSGCGSDSIGLNFDDKMIYPTRMPKFVQDLSDSAAEYCRILAAINGGPLTMSIFPDTVERWNHVTSLVGLEPEERIAKMREKYPLSYTTA